MTTPIVNKSSTLEEWRQITNQISNGIGDLSSIYTTDIPNNTGVEYTNTSDTYSYVKPPFHVNLIQNTLNNLNARKVKRSGDTITGHLNILQNFNVVGTTKLEGPLQVVPSGSGAIELTTTTGNIDISSTGTGDISISTTAAGGVLSLSSFAAGTINNLSIGVTTPLAGRFTTLTVDTSADITPSGTIVINPGTALGSAIDNMEIGTTTPAAGAFTALTVTPVTGFAVEIAPFDAGTIDNMEIGTTIAAAGTFTDLTVTTNYTISPSATGTLDNVTIGATTAAAGTFTSVTSDSITARTTDSNLTISSNGTGLIVLDDHVQISALCNFDHSLSTGTFKTSSGAVSINGSVTVASPKSFIWGASSSVSTSSGTSSGTTATVNTSGNHNLITGDYATITGVTPAGYNGTYQVTRVDNDTITYTTIGSSIGAISVQGTVTTSGIFDMSTSSGTFKTSTGTATLNGFTSCAASFGRGTPVTKTADFSVGTGENWLINNKSGSTCIVTLPTASSFTGREITIKTIQAQTVVSNANNVIPIIGGSAVSAIVAATSGKWATLVSNGTNWEIMAQG